MRFIRLPEDLCVVEKKSAEFSCEVFPPDAPVVWFLNGAEIREDPEKFHISCVNGRHYLVILETTKADEGKVSVLLGNLVCQASLTVEGM